MQRNSRPLLTLTYKNEAWVLRTGKHAEVLTNYVHKVFTGHHKTKTSNRLLNIQNEIRIALRNSFGMFVLALPEDFSTF